jgi:hypothetical protein
MGHLKRASLLVKASDTVPVRQALGMLGNSGDTH